MIELAAPGSRVRDAAVSDVQVGTTCRVRVVVDHDAGAAVPRQWFVKLPSSSRRARIVVGLVRLPQQEVRFYQHLARYFAPSCPEALVAQARLGQGFTVVLPDVTERGATTSAPIDQLSVDQAAQVIHTLAGIHYRGMRLHRDNAWLDGPARRIEQRYGGVLSIPLLRRALTKAGPAVAAALHPAIRRYAARRRAVSAELAAASAPTVVHHDCHPGNIYWMDGRPGLLDWQLVRRGDGLGDVAYLLATALAPTDRRASERALLREYLDATTSLGGDAGSIPTALVRYRKHLAYVLEAMLVTLAVGGFMAERDALELTTRAGAAAADNDAFAALICLR